MQIIENHAEISAQVLSVASATSRPGLVELRVRVLDARDVGDWPNLFARDVGQTIVILARGDVGVTAGPATVTLRVKKTGPTSSFLEG